MRILALAVALLLAAAPAVAEVVVHPDLALTDTGTTRGAATVRAGEILAVRLPGQPGTGYSWEVRPVDPGLLAPRETRCAEPPADGRVGGVVPTCFAWRAAAPGAATLAFVYRRHWETEPDGVLRYDLAVTVAPAD